MKTKNFRDDLTNTCVHTYSVYSSTDIPAWDRRGAERSCFLLYCACIFLQQYRIHMDIGHSKNYLGIHNVANSVSVCINIIQIVFFV